MSNRNRSRRRRNAAGVNGQPQPQGQQRILVVPWLGENFRLAEKIAFTPFMVFGKMAAEAVDTMDPEAFAAMYDVVWSVVHEDDWKKWLSHSTKMRADDTEILQFIQLSQEVMSGRPIGQSSDSSGGPQNTKQSSAGGASVRVLDRLNGRPDLQLAVIKAQEDRQTEQPG
jgi:hypothetical protein